jgi:hypothetical protein
MFFLWVSDDLLWTGASFTIPFIATLIRRFFFLLLFVLSNIFLDILYTMYVLYQQETITTGEHPEIQTCSNFIRSNRYIVPLYKDRFVNKLF